jgi:hypothetical protein
MKNEIYIYIKKKWNYFDFLFLNAPLFSASFIDISVPNNLSQKVKKGCEKFLLIPNA